MTVANNANTPLGSGIELSKKQCLTSSDNINQMRKIPYASTVGSIMYAMLYTPPNICYAIGIGSRYQSNPRM